jgi:hypothetical protein
VLLPIKKILFSSLMPEPFFFLAVAVSICTALLSGFFYRKNKWLGALEVMAKNKDGSGIKLLNNIFEIWQHHEPSES